MPCRYVEAYKPETVCVCLVVLYFSLHCPASLAIKQNVHPPQETGVCLRGTGQAASLLMEGASPK